jgi:5-methylthioadenosine/S-adenosylhomocysteine deaminase
MAVEAVDTLITARWVVPVAPAGTVLEHHAVAIREGAIVGLCPIPEAAARYMARDTVTLADHVLIPGLVNTHCHAGMTLWRGIADDLPLMAWLREHIWPAEAKHVSDEFVHDGSLLASAEMLAGGITCVNDMYFFPEATARATLRAGLRANLGVIAVEFPSAYAANAPGYLERGLAARDAYRGEPLVDFCLAPHAPYSVGDETLKHIAVLAEELDCPVHIHVHETKDEICDSEQKHGARPLERLRWFGLVGPRLIAVHGVHLNDQEQDLLAREGCAVVHCPSSNLKLASGIAPVAGLHGRGITLGLGTDGAASNDRLDIFTEMRTAALLAKGVTGDATTIPAHAALEMATLGGARAIGLGERIGSIEVGKRADLAAVELADLATVPCFNPVSHLVYVAGRQHVTHVWVDGAAVVADRQLTKLDVPELRAKAQWWQQKIQAP